MRVAVVLLAVACGAPRSPDPWTLWTIDTLAQRGDPAVVPAGATLRLLSPPYETLPGRQKSGQNGLTVFPAFVEGQTAAYMTTEEWQNFDEVWLQPLYVGVSTYDQNGPGSFVTAIFGVDSTTRFYSPYWQIFYFVVPPGADFRSARDVLDSGVTLHPGPGKFCPITRDPTLLAAQAEGAPAPVRPITHESIAAVRNFPAWAAGNAVRFIELGPWALNVFTWNYDTLVVHETPLFAFTRTDAAGNIFEIDLPRVGATGPVHHPTCDGRGNCSGLQSNGIPQFGALWRVYDVALPPGADAFVPASNPALRAYVQSQGLPAAIPTATGADLDQFTLRVTTTPSICFADVHDPKCVWLDSQNAIENNVADWRITETGTLVSCPLVRFNGLPKP